MMTAVPVSFSFAGRYTLSVGLVTLVIIRVDSVTSTCLRSSLGDMRTYSAPMVPVSSGALPGQRSRTSGLSAADAVAARQNPARRFRDRCIGVLRGTDG